MTTVELAAATVVLAGIGAADVPLPAQLGDGNDWVHGDCWFWCRRVEVQVLWLGPVTVSGGATAPLFACFDCITELNARVWQHTIQRDTAVAPGSRARHARPSRLRFFRLSAVKQGR